MLYLIQKKSVIARSALQNEAISLANEWTKMNILLGWNLEPQSVTWIKIDYKILHIVISSKQQEITQNMHFVCIDEGRVSGE